MSNKLGQSFTQWKAKNKDPESFAKVYDEYIDKIFRFIYFKVSDKEQAQDLSAEVFLKTWEYINAGNRIDNLNALLYRIARNIVIDHYRKRSTKDVAYEHIDQVSLNLDLDTKEVEKVEARMELESVEIYIHQLKDEYRDALLLRYIEQFSIKEVAKIMEKKPGAMRVTLHRAQKALQQLIDDNENSGDFEGNS